MDAPRGNRRRLFLVLAVASLVVLAGCGGFAGDDASGPPDRPDSFESALEEMWDDGEADPDALCS